MFLLPAVYYITHPDLGYHHSVVPAIVILMAYGASSLKKPAEGDALSS